MTDQTQIQQLIQSLTPSSVNNGNPNTIYNAGSGPVPTTNGSGDWYVPAVNPAANMNALMLQLGMWTPPAGYGGGTTTVPHFNWGGFPTGGATLPPVTPTVPGTPPVTPPTVTPQPPATGPGGNQGGTNTGSPGGGYTWNTYGGGTDGDFISGAGNGGWTLGNGGGGGSNFGSLFGGGKDFSGADGLWGLAGTPGGGGNALLELIDRISEPFVQGNFYNSQTGGLNLEGLGLNANGGMDWQQMLDLILPGNLYNSQTGNWNWNSIIGLVGGKALGIPFIATILNKIGAKMLDDDDPSNDNNFLARQVQDQRQNRLQNTMNGVMARSHNQWANTLNGAGLFNVTPYESSVNLRDIPTRVGHATTGDMIRSDGFNMGGGTHSLAGVGNVSGSTTGTSGVPRFTFNTGLGPSDVGIATPTAQTNLTFRDSNGNMVGTGTGGGSAGSGITGNGVQGYRDAGGGAVAGYGMGSHGSDVITGDAARSAFAGLAAGSDAAIKAALAAQMRKQRK